METNSRLTTSVVSGNSPVTPYRQRITCSATDRTSLPIRGAGSRIAWKPPAPMRRLDVARPAARSALLTFRSAIFGSLFRCFELGGCLVLGEVQFVCNLLLALAKRSQAFSVFEGGVRLHMQVRQPLPIILDVLRQVRRHFFQVLDRVLQRADGAQCRVGDFGRVGSGPLDHQFGTLQAVVDNE